MFNFSHEGVTIASILDTRKANKNSDYPVKIRVTYRRIRKYYVTGKALTSAEWDALPTTKSKAASETRGDIQLSFDIIKRTVQGLITEGAFSFDLLNIRLGRSLTNTLNSAFAGKISELGNEDRIGTKIYYECALSSVEKFAGKQIPFTLVTPDWLRSYEKWMLQQKMSYSTVGMYMRAIRAMINLAKDSGMIKASHYPFGNRKYEIPSAEGRKLALTIDQIQKVLQYSDGQESTEECKDLWYMSYLLNGANIGDLLKLKYSNISDGEVQFYRAKTIRKAKKKKQISATFTPTVQALFEKWGNPDKSPNNYILKYLNNEHNATDQKRIIALVVKHINTKLKVIGEAIGINGITTYSARHSFATVLKRSGADTHFISEALGHQDIKTTSNYLDSFEKHVRVKNAALLTKFE